MPVSRCGTCCMSISMPVPARPLISHEELVRSGGAHVLNADDRAGLHRFQARFQQELLHERIADLHVWPLLLGFFGELGRRHGGAVDAVASGLGADIDDRIARAFRLAVEDLAVLDHAQRENVDERIAGIAFFEDASRRRRSERRSSCRSARCRKRHLRESGRCALRVGILDRAESQRVHHGDGARAHGEDVAQDAADAGGCALKGLDEARMIVGFDLERDGVSVADVDDAGVFARALQDPAAARRELLQVEARTLIGAVLAPHHGEDAEFGVGRFAAENRDNPAVLFRRELMRRNNVGSDRCHCLFGCQRVHERAENDESIRGAHQRIGRALRMRHHAEHIALPVQNSGNVADGAIARRRVAERDAILGFEFVENAVVGVVVAFAVGDRDVQDLALRRRVGERANSSSRP